MTGPNLLEMQVINTPQGSVATEVCSIVIEDLGKRSINGVTGMELNTTSGKPSTEWGKEVLLTTTATRLAAEGDLPAINDKLNAIVLPCLDIEKTAQYINKHTTGEGYAPVSTNYAKIHGKETDGIPPR